MSRLRSYLALVAFALLGCNVDKPADSTGGVAFKESAACERGLVVVTSDYKSANIAIANLDGTTSSQSFISSGATAPGLSLALSGDVEVPRVAPASGRVVLLDRFGSNVLTWMELETATVLGQLPVGTGFESNPQDYIEFGENRAVISRFGSNPSPSQQQYDAGGDLLVLDTQTPSIIGCIPMPEEDANLLPRPSGMTTLGDTVVVTLGRLSADFDSAGFGRFVGVSPQMKKILWTVDIAGVKNCGRLAKSPSGKLGAIACSSQFDGTTYKYNPAESDIVLFDLTTTPPKELRRLGLAQALDAGLQPTLEFASESQLVALTYGGNSTAGDRALAADVDSGAYEGLLESAAPYSLGGLHCAPGCGDICVIADAEAGKLRRFSLSTAGKFTPLDDVTVDSIIGLPPRAIGSL